MQLLRKLLFPFSLVYGLIVYIRNSLYDRGILESKEFDVPTICIGNLSVGGTGKTPMTEFLIKLLQPKYKIAVLSRGYKRKSSGFVLANDNTSVEQLGDEPYQIYRKFKNITVAVDADRREGIRQLVKRVHPDLILLDDAFQHRKVNPGFSILLTSYGNLYVDDWYLPTGDLRDSKYAAKRADLIVVTKCSPLLSNEEQKNIIAKLKSRKNQRVLFTFFEYDELVKNDKESIKLSEFARRRLTLVTGIANPEPLVKYLKEKGFPMEHLAFNDHHFFSEKEIDELKTRELIITTEKDYVRLCNKLSNLFYLPVKHAFLSDGEYMIGEELNTFMKAKT